MTYFLTPFAFFISCSSALRIEYILGRSLTYSAIGVPLHSSLNLPMTFLFCSLKSDGPWSSLRSRHEFSWIPCRHIHLAFLGLPVGCLCRCKAKCSCCRTSVLVYCNTSRTSDAWISPGHTSQHRLVYLILILSCVNGVPIILQKI